MRWWYLIPVALLIGGCVSSRAPARAEQPEDKGAQAIATSLVPEARLYDQTTLQGLLEKGGLKVTSTAATNSYALFSGLRPGASIGFWLDQGVADVTFFPETVEGRLRVAEVGRFAWEIRGWTPDPQEVGSNRRLHFIIHRNLFISTYSEEVHNLVGHALGLR